MDKFSLLVNLVGFGVGIFGFSNESTAADSVERKRALSGRGRASLMQAARPSMQIEAYRYACVQICPIHCVRIAILNLVESKPILKVGTTGEAR